MATVTQIEDKNGNVFDIEDSDARTKITEILNLIPNGATKSNQLATSKNVADEETRAKAQEAELLSKLENYGKESLIVFDNNFRTRFQRAAEAASDYSLFTGGTGAGSEGGWVGFRHTLARVGALIIRSDGLYFASNASGDWTWRQIF